MNEKFNNALSSLNNQNNNHNNNTNNNTNVNVTKLNVNDLEEKTKEIYYNSDNKTDHKSKLASALIDNNDVDNVYKFVKEVKPTPEQYKKFADTLVVNHLEDLKAKVDEIKYHLTFLSSSVICNTIPIMIRLDIYNFSKRVATVLNCIKNFADKVRIENCPTYMLSSTDNIFSAHNLTFTSDDNISDVTKLIYSTCSNVSTLFTEIKNDSIFLMAPRQLKDTLNTISEDFSKLVRNILPNQE